MPTKVTLTLDSKLLERAKARARQRGVSVSDLVQESLSTALADATQVPFQKEALPPITRSLCGALKGARSDQSDYVAYLEEKHR